MFQIRALWLCLLLVPVLLETGELFMLSYKVHFDRKHRDDYSELSLCVAQETVFIFVKVWSARQKLLGAVMELHRACSVASISCLSTGTDD